MKPFIVNDVNIPWKEYPVKYGVMFKVETAIDSECVTADEINTAKNTNLVQTHTKVLDDHLASLSLAQDTRRHDNVRNPRVSNPCYLEDSSAPTDV